jgi:hypothetical protein
VWVVRGDDGLVPLVVAAPHNRVRVGVGGLVLTVVEEIGGQWKTSGGRGQSEAGGRRRRCRRQWGEKAVRQAKAEGREAHAR